MKGNHVFSFLYRTRVKVAKGETPIMNFSLLFTIVAAACAPWVAVIGLVVSLVLGYHFSVQRDSPEFCGDFQKVVNDAAATVKNAVDSLKDTDQPKEEHTPDQPKEEHTPEQPKEVHTPEQPE